MRSEKTGGVRGSWRRAHSGAAAERGGVADQPQPPGQRGGRNQFKAAGHGQRAAAGAPHPAALRRRAAFASRHQPPRDARAPAPGSAPSLTPAGGARTFAPPVPEAPDEWSSGREDFDARSALRVHRRRLPDATADTKPIACCKPTAATPRDSRRPFPEPPL